MSYWKCFYHIIWATKHRAPILLPTYERVLFEYIRQRSVEQDCQLIAVNCTLDHIHLALSIPPTVLPSEVIANLKGASSRKINQSFPNQERFRWQDSYGILTFSENALSHIVTYIENQKQHHAQGSLEPRLEHIE